MTTPPAVPSAVNRKPDRSPDDRAVLDAILDAVLVGTLATVAGGEPWAVPMLFARDGDRILLHGSTGAGALRHVAAGAPAVLSVIALDGIVVAHNTFESSANYRSAVVRGRVVPLTGPEQARALDLLSDRLIPGRTGEVAPSTPKERSATLAMALPIVDGLWTVKVRTGGPSVPEGPTDAWSGVVALRTVADPPQPAAWVPEGDPLPDSVRRLVNRVTAGWLR